MNAFYTDRTSSLFTGTYTNQQLPSPGSSPMTNCQIYTPSYANLANRMKPSVVSGMMFGMLTALYCVKSSDNDKECLWICQCKCKCRILASVYSLIRGEVFSCGRHKTHLGKRFGKLTVYGYAIEVPSSNIDYDKVIYKCVCDCNKTVHIHHLDITTTYSCGCMDEELGVKTNTVNIEELMEKE